jgi:hypothetical protein
MVNPTLHAANWYKDGYLKTELPFEGKVPFAVSGA